MEKVVLLKDIKYNGVTHKTGTSWPVDGWGAKYKNGMAYILAGHGAYIDLKIGEDAKIVLDKQ